MAMYVPDPQLRVKTLTQTELDEAAAQGILVLFVFT